MKTNDIRERLWLFAAVAVVIAFICSQIWIGKNYDYQRKPPVVEKKK
jgi:lipoprotein signal peptidase